MGVELDHRVGVAVVCAADRVLVGVRPEDAPLGGMAEFPGGKIEPSETPWEAACRECFEETGVPIVHVADGPVVYHRYEHASVELHFFFARPAVAGLPRPAPPFRWLPRSALAGQNFPPANASVLKRLH